MAIPRGLYAIADTGKLPPAALLSFAARAIAGGAVMLQYRDKQCTGRQQRLRRLREAAALACLCRATGVPFIVNDDVPLARAVEADGVHLGGEDLPIATARAVLGEHSIIGASCYASLARARVAVRDGASYVAFGALFPSPTKPGAVRAPALLLRAAQRQLTVPVAAIGGIHAGNVARIAAAGADLVAVISALTDAQDVQRSAHSIQSRWSTWSRT